MSNPNYYKSQLNNVKPHLTEYAPTVKIFANGNGIDTKHLSLNSESATELIEYLAVNFLNDETLLNVLNRLNSIPLNYNNQ